MVKEVIYNKCDENFESQVDNKEIEFNEELHNKEINHTYENINNKKDIFTSLVRIKGAKFNVVSVKSNKVLDKKLWLECSKVLSRLYVGAPIKIGDVVCKNILNTGVDIVCTRNVEKFIE